MGGRGTFAAGKNVAYTYETVGKIEGVKVLEKTNKNASGGLPEMQVAVYQKKPILQLLISC